MEQVTEQTQVGRAMTSDQIAKFAEDFVQQPQHRPLMNAIKKNGIQDVAIDQDAIVRMQYTFSTEIATGDITNQKQSGRCWLFAGLNMMRKQVATTCNLKTFELSQTYQMFWDKFEKANYFLESILDTLDEETNGRLVAWLLTNPLNDGGQWDMFVNLVKKYGVVPKHVMPETFHSSQSSMMNRLLTVKLREFAAHLRGQYAAGAAVDALRADKARMLNEIYRMLCHFLGEPPTRFDFEYRDQADVFHRAADLTPETFYAQFVGVDLDDYVSVINAPTADKPFDRTFTVQYLGNVVGGQPVLYLNVDIETLRDVTLAQLADDEPVWFGCDVGQMLHRDHGIMDLKMYDYSAALGVPFHMTKAQRLDYGESLMTHAMMFTGVNVVDGQPNRWKVENSWGKDRGKDGFFIMSDDWFSEFMYQVVVRKSYLPPSLRTALEASPIQLPPWDPMGSLATSE